MVEQPPATKPQRLSLSTILELMLARGSGDRSSVSLTRNAKGETQIEVVIRTGDSGEILSPADAEREASEVYNRLRAAYPLSSGLVGAEGGVAVSPPEGP